MMSLHLSFMNVKWRCWIEKSGRISRICHIIRSMMKTTIIKVSCFSGSRFTSISEKWIVDTFRRQIKHRKQSEEKIRSETSVFQGYAGIEEETRNSYNANCKKYIIPSISEGTSIVIQFCTRQLHLFQPALRSPIRFPNFFILKEITVHSYAYCKVHKKRRKKPKKIPYWKANQKTQQNARISIEFGPRDFSGVYTFRHIRTHFLHLFTSILSQKSLKHRS